MAWPSGDAGTAPSPSPPPGPSAPPPPYQPYQPWQSPSAPSASSPGLLFPQPQYAWHTGDPRSSSTQSLAPSLHEGDGRRILLVVYIHGFMGDNTSFRSFPSHVHNYLHEALAESHAIHSKIYPRYKTYKAITVARNNFSEWLQPHESEITDVVLVGHSMGGLLAADVALMPSPSTVYGQYPKHRILGTISLDAPLLGLHPGIIKSGIASLFRKAPDPPTQDQELAESLASQNDSGHLSIDDRMSYSTDGVASSGMTSPTGRTSSDASGLSLSDPNFNPPFFNDVQFIDRGWWKNVAHFAKKHHSEGLFTSTYRHLLSHLEFGGCLADYASLNSRYNKIRRLEDVDELTTSENNGRREVRVRFVNYYTVSTGVPKEPQPPKRVTSHLQPGLPEAPQSLTTTSSQTPTPRISVEDFSDGEGLQKLQLLEPVPEPDSEPEEAVESPPPREGDKGDTQGEKATGAGDSEQQGEDKDSVPPASQAPAGRGEDVDPNSDLPAIPPLPEPPQAPNFEQYSEKDARKQAEKEFRRVQKTYDQAVKNREKAIKERQKLVEKRRKKALKDAEKRQREDEKRLAKELKEHDAQQSKNVEDGGTDEAAALRAQVVTPAQTQALQKQLTDLALHDPTLSVSSSSSEAMRAPLSPPPATAAAAAAAATGREGQKNPSSAADGKKKLRKFCMLPQKTNGVRDPTWVEVYMDGVDEVGAHCGLFFAGPHYEKLVGDVGSRIVGWVQEDMSKRTILALD